MRQIKCVLYRNNFGQNKFSGYCEDVRWQWHVEPQISICKENKYDTNTSACYTGIISGKLNSVDIVKT